MSTKKQNIRPLGDKVVVKPEDAETKTAGGIVIPDTSDKDKPMQGTVIAIGNGKYIDGKRIPVDITIGNRVLFGKYAGTNIKINNTEYLVMREEDVMGVIEEA